VNEHDSYGPDCAVHNSMELFHCEACYAEDLSQCPTCTSWLEEEIEEEIAWREEKLELAEEMLVEVAELTGETIDNLRERAIRLYAGVSADADLDS